MGVLAAAATIGASILGAIGTISAANAQASAAEAQADERERVAQEERAVATREAAEREREERLVQSTLQARAASSGGGASDPTVARLAGQIAARGSYQRRGAIYEGESSARTLEAQAAVDRMQARAYRTQGYFGAASSVLGGVGSLGSYLGRRQQTTPGGYRGYYS